MTKILRKLIALWEPAECGAYRRVLVKGRVVKMTAQQARRCEELRQEETTG